MNMFGARPPNPFARGIGGIGGAATTTKRVRIPSDLDFGVLYLDYIKGRDLLLDLTLSASIRHVDQLRNHPVSSSEHDLYNIPAGSTRLMTGDRKNVLALCGSNKGGRFETADFKFIGDTCSKVEESYQRVDSAFKELTSDEKKYKENATDSTQTPAIKKLLSYRAAYLSDYGALVGFIKTKRKALSEDPPGGDFQIDPEAEMKLASPFPPYLSLLLSKYRMETNPKLAHKDAVADNLARLSAFLAACAVGLVWCGSSEQAALDTLLAACDANAFEAGNTEKLRRRRIFKFLKGMREIKGVPKRE
eukprot:CAMPEP_0118645232 /NCGR_PEP_ID=MMETSP0785-20121206/7386_1 /TAXON_ID=91992 /ORGANISM="Bolidomonas pacifica, Strain CCMP 1866" /LENGTH=304 /DNA_ID=CAMNT_0006537091 /DNA_START=151 /DNA_END=1062 /DNA_ORIENTATION=-